MSNKREQFDKSLSEHKTQGFSGAERTTMRENLMAHTKASPISTPGLTKSPYSWMVTLARPAVAVALVLIISCGGVAYAAENSLPGDSLYGWKRNVNEPIRWAFTMGVDADIAWQEELALRRLDEAIVLEQQDRLSTEHKVELESSYEKHVQARNKRVEDKRQRTNADELRLANEQDIDFALRTEAKIQALAETNTTFRNVLLDATPAVNVQIGSGLDLNSGGGLVEPSTNTGAGDTENNPGESRNTESEPVSNVSKNARIDDTDQTDPAIDLSGIDLGQGADNQVDVAVPGPDPVIHGQSHQY